MSVTTIGWTATIVPKEIGEKQPWYGDGRIRGLPRTQWLENGDVVLPGFTFNPWWGCVEYGNECDFCYARTFSRRVGHQVWGKQAPRRFFGDEYWAKPLLWNQKAKALGVRLRVFCSSMADIGEHYKHVDDNPIMQRMNTERQRVWALAEQTPHLLWLFLTKRIENILQLVPETWLQNGFPENVWFGTSIGTNKTLERRMKALQTVPASVRFISYEPALEAVDFSPYLTPEDKWWLITGGESGFQARWFDEAWARQTVETGKRHHVPVFVKQMGTQWAKEQGIYRVDKKGEDWTYWPEDLHVQQWPS